MLKMSSHSIIILMQVIAHEHLYIYLSYAFIYFYRTSTNLLYAYMFISAEETASSPIELSVTHCLRRIPESMKEDNCQRWVPTCCRFNQ